MTEETGLTCYNKGCGKAFDPANNDSDSCNFHPGVPIFHDAMKGWSCCKKRSTDFTEFLNFPGCTTGCHSNVKPVAPQPKQDTSTKEEVLVQYPPVHKPLTNEAPLRPPSTEPLVTLPTTVAASLKTALEQHMEKLKLASPTTPGECCDSPTQNGVAVGTSCHNKGCNESYVDESSLTGTCLHHPGVPIFHEGMKYWSCCQRKTSEFDSFLSQEGCTESLHRWTPREEDLKKEVTCRVDWHQTPGFVTISMFAKLTDESQTVIQCNAVKVGCHIVFDGGKSIYDREFLLKGVVDPAKSKVKLLGSKVEINLKKADASSWTSLEMPPTTSSEEQDS